MPLNVQIENWSPPAGEVALRGGCVHLWRGSLEQPDAVLDRLAGWLSDDERERAARFRHDRHRNKYIVGRAMLRDVLARYVGVYPRDIAFSYLSHGKPTLAGAPSTPSLEFNLSHSGNVALCAVTQGTALGVDVERIRSLRDMQGLADRFFSTDEAERIRVESEGEQLASFFRCWTRKEAYVKATGEGITCRLDSFAVSVGANDPARLLHIDQDSAAAANWSMVTIVPADGYIGAMAMPARIDSTCGWVWNPSETCL